MLTYVFVPCVRPFSSIVSSLFVGLLVLVIPSIRVSFYLSLCLFVRIVVFSRVYGVCLCASSIRLRPTGHCVHRWQGVCLPLPAPLNVYANPFFCFLLPFPIWRVLSSWLSAAILCGMNRSSIRTETAYVLTTILAMCISACVYVCELFVADEEGGRVDAARPDVCAQAWYRQDAHGGAQLVNTDAAAARNLCGAGEFWATIRMSATSPQHH